MSSVAAVDPSWRIVDSGAPQERAGEHDRHGTLQDARQHQRQAQPTDRRHASGRERSHWRRPPHDATPCTAHSSHEVGRRQPLSERDGDDRDDGDSDAYEGEGGSGHDPTVCRGHDQVANARDDSGTDESAGAAEAPDPAIGQGAPQEVPDGSRRRGRDRRRPLAPPIWWWPGARGHRSPCPGRGERQATIRTRIRRRRSANRSRAPSQIEFDSARSGGAGAFERNWTKGMHEEMRATASAKNGADWLTAKSDVPTTGPARYSAPASVPVKTPLARSRASSLTSSGTIAWRDE